METLDRCRSPVRRQVEAYEESWRKDHEALKVDWALEDTISVGLATFTVLQRAERTWRQGVFRGAEEYAEETNKFFVGLNQVWLSITEHVVACAAELESECVTLEGVDQLREQAHQVKQHLETWKSPSLSAAGGLHEMDLLSEERKQELLAFWRDVLSGKIQPEVLRNTPQIEAAVRAEEKSIPCRLSAKGENRLFTDIALSWHCGGQPVVYLETPTGPAVLAVGAAEMLFFEGSIPSEQRHQTQITYPGFWEEERTK
jgi:hypothetical protein